MQLFYAPNITPPIYTLEEEESKHCVRVLRLGVGDELDITVTELLNGKDKKEQNVIKYIQHENKKSKRKTIITAVLPPYLLRKI